MYAIVWSFILKVKDYIGYFVIKYWYVLVAVLVMLGCYQYGYYRGSQVADGRLAEQAQEFSRQIEESRARIKELQEDNKRLSESLDSAGKSIDRATEYTSSAAEGIEGVIAEMRSYTETK